MTRWARARWCTGLLTVVLAPRPAIAGPEATDALQACVQDIRSAPGLHEGYACVYRVARTQGRYDEAIAVLRSVLADDASNPRAHDSLAGLLDDTGAPNAAVHFGAAIEGYAAADERDLEVYARMNYASHLAGHDPEAAVDQLRLARSIAAELDDPVLVAITEVSWARQLASQGEDLAEGLRLVRRAEPVLLAQGKYQSKLVLLHTKHRLLAQIGRDAEEVETLRTMIAMSRAAGDDFVAAGSMLSLAILLANKPDLRTDPDQQDASVVAREALEIATRMGNPHVEAGAHCVLGDYRQDDPLAHYEACRAGYEALDAPDDVGSALTSMAIAMIDSDPQGAFARLDEADVLVRERGGVRLDNQVTRALLQWEIGATQDALASSIEALDLAEATFWRQLDPLTRAQVLARWSSVYYVLADRILAAGGPQPPATAIDAALRVVERMRTRVLVERLEAARSPQLSPGPLSQAHRDAVVRITELQRRLLEDDLDVDARRAVLRDLERAEQDEAALAEAIVRADPALAAMQGERPPTLAQVQAALAPDQAVLSYQLATALPRAAPDPWPVRSSLFVITKQRAFVVPLADRETLEPLVDLFTGLFEARDGSEAVPAAGLYRDLLATAIASLDPAIDRLVIVPDGPLHRLPFAALRADVSGPPLVAQFSLTSTPSLRLWLRLRQGDATTRSAALVFADPALPRLNPDAATERAWAWSLAEGLGPLPHARAEAEALAHRLGPQTELHIGAAATEAGVKRAGADGFAVLHFASHALLDDANPQRAAIVLAPGDASEDGLLQTREIAELSFPGALVVLASCSSGSGTVVGGEGPIGLARAFFLANARSVVATLWRVRDDDSEAFFGAFYRHLDRGLTVSAAVAAAQNDRRRAGADAAAWAGFVVLGDGDFAPFPADPSPRTLLWVLLTAAGLVVVAWRPWRRRARAV